MKPDGIIRSLKPEANRLGGSSRLEPLGATNITVFCVSGGGREGRNNKALQSLFPWEPSRRGWRDKSSIREGNVQIGLLITARQLSLFWCFGLIVIALRQQSAFPRDCHGNAESEKLERGQDAESLMKWGISMCDANMEHKIIWDTTGSSFNLIPRLVWSTLSLQALRWLD